MKDTKRRKKPFPAKKRSRLHLEALGYHVADVEKRIPGTFITQDLFGFADLLAFNETETLLVQVTTSDHAADHRRTIKSKAEATHFADGPNRRVVLHCWAKRGKRGEAKEWTLAVDETIQPDEAHPPQKVFTAQARAEKILASKAKRLCSRRNNIPLRRKALTRDAPRLVASVSDAQLDWLRG